MRIYLSVAWGFTLVLVVYAIIAGNTESIPSWTIAIPGVIVGFWWAFGRTVLGVDPNEGRQRDRDIKRGRNTPPAA